jgi:hypothetical protein
VRWNSNFCEGGGTSCCIYCHFPSTTTSPSPPPPPPLPPLSDEAPSSPGLHHRSPHTPLRRPRCRRPSLRTRSIGGRRGLQLFLSSNHSNLTARRNETLPPTLLCLQVVPSPPLTYGLPPRLVTSPPPGIGISHAFAYRKRRRKTRLAPLLGLAYIILHITARCPHAAHAIHLLRSHRVRPRHDITFWTIHTSALRAVNNLTENIVPNSTYSATIHVEWRIDRPLLSFRTPKGFHMTREN